MARYIDADEFFDGFCIYAIGQDKAFIRAVKEVLEDTPTADVVEVVRCKDCLYWWKENELCIHSKCCHDGTVAVVEAPPTHFCGYGERK